MIDDYDAYLGSFDAWTQWGAYWYNHDKGWWFLMVGHGRWEQR